MNEGVGYLAYKEDVEFMDSAKIRGHNIGLLSEFTYMYNISSKFSFGLSATLLSGSLSSSKITSGGVSEKVKLEQKEGLSNVSFSLALRLDI
ncbi:MAG: hypothetical protein IJ151_07030 [Bacteroidales bacterium]|nr:hypothetical protein [Bacteroidales bacterium]